MESFVLKNSFINMGNKNMSFMMPVEDVSGEKVNDHAKEIFVELFQSASMPSPRGLGVHCHIPLSVLTVCTGRRIMLLLFSLT